MRIPRTLALVAGTALVVAACSGGGASPAPSLPTEIGEGEGELTVLAWPGYAEDGSTDPAIDWITPFEEESSA